MLCLVATIALACDRYNPAQDNIPDLPTPSHAHAIEAMRLINRMIEEHPGEPFYRYKKGLMYLQRGEWQEAVDFLQQALRYDSLNAQYRYALSTAYHAQEAYKPALQTLQRVLPKLDNDFKALLLAGELYYQQKQYHNATKYLNKALKITPHEADVYFWKGSVALARLDTAVAIRNLNLALQHKPDYALAYNAFGEMYSRYALYDLAIQYTQKGLRYAPKEARLYFTKAEAFRMKRYADDSAKANYEKAYQLNRKQYMTAYYLGKYAYDAGKYEEAKRYFEAAVRQEPVFATAHYYIGMCLRISGNKEEALKKFGLAMKQDAKLFAAADMYWALQTEIQQERYLRYEDSLRRSAERIAIDTTRKITN